MTNNSTGVGNGTLTNSNAMNPPIDYLYTRTYKIVSTAMIFAIMILAIFGNALVVAAFKKFQKLRNVTNYFVVSLAVADILISSTSMPIWAAHIVTGPDPNWEKIDRSAFSIWTFCDILCGLASIFNLTCISIERYMCISAPLHYYQRMRTKKALIVIIFVWCLATFFASIRLIFKDVEPPILELFYTIVGFFIPLLTMIIMYSLIFRVACNQVKKMDILIGGQTKKFRLRKEIKAAKTLGIVFGAFFICWSPFFMLNFLAVCRPCFITVGRRMDVIIAAKWFHYVNSVLNPLIYARMNKEFREAFTRILLNMAVTLRIRDDDLESELQQLERRSSSVVTSAKRRKSSAPTLHQF